MVKTKIPKYKKLNPLWWFGNEDDGWCGDEYWFRRFCKSGCTLMCKLKWFIRNPLHNFFFYVVGFADEPIITQRGYTFWNPNGGFNFSIRYPEDRPFIKLPFLSYKGRSLEWYIGWRERGNFGIAIRR